VELNTYKTTELKERVIVSVKILMGLHPNAGWRSFKTDTDILRSQWSELSGVMVHINNSPLLLSEDFRKNGLTDFGRRLLFPLATSPGIHFLRYRQRQIEIYIAEEVGWEESLRDILSSIAYTHSRGFTSSFNLEVRNMSDGEPSWQAYFLEELEEIEELENSFVTH
jgi:hypothetical protein